MYLEKKLCALLHDLLDLQEAGGVHQQELVSHVHAQAARVAEGQDLLEALRLHSRRQLHHRTFAAGVEQVAEIRRAGRQHRAVGLGRATMDAIKLAAAPGKVANHFQFSF